MLAKLQFHCIYLGFPVLHENQVQPYSSQLGGGDVLEAGNCHNHQRKKNL